MARGFNKMIKVIGSSSAGNACYIGGRSPLLLDCGLQYKRIQQGTGFNISGLSGCLLTHEHKDHSRAAQELLRAGIDIYLSGGTKAALGLNSHRLREVKARKLFKINNEWIVLPFDTCHDAEEPLGFMLADRKGRRILYATDTAYIKYTFSKLTHILIECNYSMDVIRENVKAGRVEREMKKRIIKTHFGLENVKEFLRVNNLSKVEEIHLLHLSDDNSDAERFKREVQAVTGKPVYVAGK